MQLLVSGLITFVLGGAVGAFILGVYLFVSIRIFGRHGNEAFSSLRIQDFKQWLRLRIDAAGALTIYAIAIDRVPRRWRAAQRGGEATHRGGRRARDARRDSSTGLKCAPDEGARLQRATVKRNQATGQALAAHVEPFEVTM